MSESTFEKLANNNFLFRFYMLKSLPMAFIAGIRVKELTKEKAITTVKFKWLTQNPFRSMYFACEAMAAEMSTGLLVLNSIYKSPAAISTLIVENKALYFKKAVGEITFTCIDEINISSIIDKAKKNGEPVIIDLKSTGVDEEGEKVAEFIFTWSLKVKSHDN